MTEPIEKGDVVTFDYDVFIDGKFLESSRKETLEEHHGLKPGARFRPYTFVVGTRSVIPGVEKAIIAQGVTPEGADPVHTVVLPEDAYGLRSPKMMRTVPSAHFKGKSPQIGQTVEFEGRQAMVVKAEGGRVLLDLHHQLAGKTLSYYIIVRAVHKEPKQRVAALLNYHLDGASFGWDTETPPEGHEGPWDPTPHLRVMTPEQFCYDPRWMGMRVGIVRMIVNAFDTKPVKITFVETYNPPKREPAPAQAEDAPPETPPEQPQPAEPSPEPQERAEPVLEAPASP